MKRLSTGAALAVAAIVAAAPGCGARRQPEALPDGRGVSVDVESLWSKEAPTDPILSYRLRLLTDPDNPALHNNLGNAYVHENLMDEAIREYRAASRLDDRSPVPWNNIGTTYRKMGRVSAAHQAFRKAIRIDDRYALAYYNIGTLYDDAGDYDTAIDYYLKALALRPELAEVEFNPQVVENRNLMVVKLRHFLEESGNIALPLDRLPE
ncbi:MAG TPA: tetratricopeptide repeat protein [Candidatus Polarisedimenticolia bacterium]|nr:tetratricopeptide repeat protein [Candidatus Polarisedimenticolia bacterium]